MRCLNSHQIPLLSRLNIVMEPGKLLQTILYGIYFRGHFRTLKGFSEKLRNEEGVLRLDGLKPDFMAVDDIKGMHQNDE